MSKPSSMPLIKFLLIFSFAGFIPTEKNDPFPKTNMERKSAQEIFSYLRCHKQGKNNISVNWGTISLAGITKFVVYHSEDNDFFDPVEEIDVVNGTLKYSYKHEDLFPGYHYYYIAAVKAAGPPVTSITDVVRIVGH